jgi:hypothetical protein
VASYEDLLERADREPEWFFSGLLKHIDYRFYRPYERVLDDSRGTPGGAGAPAERRMSC